MAYLQISHVAIKGIAGCVPSQTEEIADLTLFKDENEKAKIIHATGIERHRVADADTCTSDLCCKAAERLLEELSWNREDIDCLISITQTPDYLMPANAGFIQHRLGLKKDCMAFDITLGCSGWVYGLSVISSLLASGQIKKGLLLTGDTPTRWCSRMDKTTYPIFGDAGAATALEYDENAPDMYFHLQTDGSGAKQILVPEGHDRSYFRQESLTYQNIGDGICRNRLQIILDGMGIISFAITNAPKNMEELLERYNLEKQAIDYFLLHQANLLINTRIIRKMKLDSDKAPISLKDFGNTSSATIPITLITRCASKFRNEKVRALGCGFGVGLSCGSVYFETNRIKCLDLIEY